MLRASTERDNGGEVEVHGGGQTSTYRFATVKLNVGLQVDVIVNVDAPEAARPIFLRT